MYKCQHLVIKKDGVLQLFNPHILIQTSRLFILILNVVCTSLSGMLCSVVCAIHSSAIVPCTYSVYHCTL